MHAIFFLVIFHRGFRRQRLGTRSSVRVLPLQHGPYCDRLRTYRPHWADRQHPGKNWRRTSLTGQVRGRRLTVCAKQSPNTVLYQVSKKLSVFFCSSFNPPFLFNSGCPDTAGRCCGEGAIGNRRAAFHQVPAGLSGVPEFPASPGEGSSPGTAGL